LLSLHQDAVSQFSQEVIHFSQPNVVYTTQTTQASLISHNYC